MKYIIVIGDGMADAFTGNTPFAAAEKPMMNTLAAKGICGLVQTIPEGYLAGSDIAALTILGLTPQEAICRAPLEALGMKLPFLKGDRAMRVNFITLSEEVSFSDRRIIQFGTDPLTRAEGESLKRALQPLFSQDGLFLSYSNMYRMLAIEKGTGKQKRKLQFTPPQEIVGKQIGPYLPVGQRKYRKLMEEASSLLISHPVNRKRQERGEGAANGIWFWGAGSFPEIPRFYETHQRKGTLIAGIELLKGIGEAVGLTVPEVLGATGGIDTDYSAKAKAALDALKKHDFVLVHVEAPDIFGHRKDFYGKVEAISQLDKKIIAPMVQSLMQRGEAFRIIVLPDHLTPVETGTHTAEPVPFLLFDSRKEQRKMPERKEGFLFEERTAGNTGVFYAEGTRLIRELFAGASLEGKRNSKEAGKREL